MDCNEINKTLTFDEQAKGWTSFHSFDPDFMLGMNSNFFSFKDGELYKHHSDNVPRNTFYGVQYPSKVSVVVNDSPSEIKQLQAVSLEGNNSWDALIRAYISNSDDYSESSIKKIEFVKSEGIWYAYARRNESTDNFDSNSTYGLGTVSSITPTTFVLNGGSTSLCVGDSIIRGSDLVNIGIITDIFEGNIIKTGSTTGLISGDYILGMKDPRVEGGNLRGYSMRLDLSTQENDKVELFAVNTDVIKSFS
jgi:hypothetical protein